MFTKLDQLTKENITFYNDENQFLKDNYLTSLDDREEWQKAKQQGFSSDGNYNIIPNLCPFGGAWTDEDCIHAITDSLLEFLDGDYYLGLEDNNQDLPDDEKLDLDNLYEVYWDFLLSGQYDFIAYKQTNGKYKNNICLVIKDN